MDAVWAPAYEGGHQDHDATSFLASAVAERPVIEYAEYNACAGAQAFPAPTGAETLIRLTAAETATKAALLRIYRSETLNLMNIGCRQEALRPLAAYDYARPPHAGRLFYQRFHWLPFHHPRVDFTPPAEVSEAFARFGAGPRQKGWTTHG
jgi:N-acetylglucosamine malate deacetylase 1